MIAANDPESKSAPPLPFNYEFRDGKLTPTDEHPIQRECRDYDAAMRDAGYSRMASDNAGYPIVTLYENDEAEKWPWVIGVAPGGNANFDVLISSFPDLLAAFNLMHGLVAFSAAWVSDDTLECIRKSVEGKQ